MYHRSPGEISDVILDDNSPFKKFLAEKKVKGRNAKNKKSKSKIKNLPI
jgi:hypothetical protein